MWLSLTCTTSRSLLISKANFVAFFYVLVGQDGFEDLSVEQEMHSCFRKAAVNLKEVIKIPGVWDPFVKCYVDVRACFTDIFLFCFSVYFSLRSLSAAFLYVCGWQQSILKATHLCVYLTGFDLDYILLLVELQSLHGVQKGLYLCIAKKKK